VRGKRALKEKMRRRMEMKAKKWTRQIRRMIKALIWADKEMDRAIIEAGKKIVQMSWELSEIKIPDLKPREKTND
jgi:hypothetical protein